MPLGNYYDNTIKAGEILRDMETIINKPENKGKKYVLLMNGVIKVEIVPNEAACLGIRSYIAQIARGAPFGGNDPQGYWKDPKYISTVWLFQSDRSKYSQAVEWCQPHAENDPTGTRSPLDLTTFAIAAKNEAAKP